MGAAAAAAAAARAGVSIQLFPRARLRSARGKMTVKLALILVTLLLAPGARSDLLDYGDDEEDLHDTTVNQVLVPRSHQEDATRILNTLLRDYDKTLRPDIGEKPTVIDVGIYVNSIGPVSSIDMVSLRRSSLLHLISVLTPT
ncbi:gamma-aminobutyric acid receptor subunit gamma-3-like [Nothobranchius furzeri]|uniref:Gamma-aminobutyric acid receptor subunit gamma-3-like n=1 Tax=Nothobranchius furzeri TaxID=105023 RepID=A0A8C6KCW4_NOTFU|nr:gamma-aminobutyric acid receptor subunit gamma-3-like [Nothobranchius furzeri]KAF7214906.1 gamma-aminobutyric acid receptor subunit gamma-3-like [Nothobranchius furzeri]